MTSEYTDKQRIDIAQREYYKYKVGKSVKIDNGQTNIGYVSQVKKVKADKKGANFSKVLSDILKALVL